MATRSGANRVIPVRAFRAEDLESLLAPAEPPCVSIYLPTSRRYPEKRQAPTRYRDLLVRAESLLRSGSPPGREVDRMLEPLRSLEQDWHWEYSLDGLAVFHSGSFGVAYRLPFSVPERVVVAESFHVKPLVRFLHANRRYFVLALSQNEVSLYEGSPFGAGTVELRGVPQSLRDAIGVPDFDRAVSVHGGGVAFHGRGPGKEETKEALLRYFRAIDKGLHEFLRGERAPLLLAAVKYYHPIYREANTYPHLLEEGLEGNFQHVNGNRIHAEAWPIVNRAFERSVAGWAERYHGQAARGLAGDGIETVAQAVLAGRVWAVLAAEGETVWGVLDRRTGAVHYHDRQQGTEDDDLIDDLCEEALKRGAEVYVVPRASMPTANPIAAVYRF